MHEGQRLLSVGQQDIDNLLQTTCAKKKEIVQLSGQAAVIGDRNQPARTASSLPARMLPVLRYSPSKNRPRVLSFDD